MPLEKCKKGGMSGFRWGSSGACYTGPGGKKKALKQGLAEVGGDSQKFKEELAKSSVEVGDDEVEKTIASHAGTAGFGNKYLDRASAYISKKERDKMPKEDFADPPEGFPLPDQKHLDAAVKLLGRAPKSKQAAIKRRIIEIAKRKGLKLPDSWTEKSEKK